MKKFIGTAAAIVLLLALAGMAPNSFSRLSLAAKTQTAVNNQIQFMASGLEYVSSDAASAAFSGNYPETVPAQSRETASNRLIMLGEDTADDINGSPSKYRHDYLLDKFWLRYRTHLIMIAIFVLLSALHASFSYISRKKQYRKLEASEEMLRNVTNNINGGVLVLIPQKAFHISYVNDGFMKLTGYSIEEINAIREEYYISYVHPEDREKLNCDVVPAEPEEGGPGDFSIQLRIMSKSGKYIPVLIKGSLVTNEQGENEMFCVVMDVSREQAMMEELKFEQERHRILLEKSDEILFEVNYEEETIKISPKFREKFGWSPPKKYWGGSEPDLSFVYEDDRTKYLKALQEIECGKIDGELKFRVFRSDRTPCWCKVIYHVMRTDGRQMQLIGKLTDIDGEMKEKQTLMKKAQVDALTGLYNKEAFKTRSTDYLTNNPDRNSVIVFIDVDNFKEINDRLGHAVGDRALCNMSQKMLNVFSSRDILGRFGGDEFCVLVKDTQKEELRSLLERLLDELRLTYCEGRRTVQVSVSVGAVCSCEYGTDFNKLLEYADKAQYFTKVKGKDAYTLYCDDIKNKEYEGRRKQGF